MLVNEVLTRSTSPLEDAVELFNPSPGAVDVGGWFLSDSRRSETGLRKFRIPDGTVIAPGGHAVLYEYQFNAAPGSPGSFALDSAGDVVFLASADPAGNLTGHVVGHRFEGALEGVSFGTHATSAGADFAAMRERTFGADQPATIEEFRAGGGAPNSPPLIGTVVINEVHYHPAEGDVEFLELYNRGEVSVALHDATLGRGWRLSGVRDALGVDDYEFPAATRIPAGGFLLLVPIDPEVFRRFRSLSAEVPIAGPFGGALSNGGERLKLSMPATTRDGDLAYVVVDQVRYDDADPWPAEVDGQGPSLERVEASGYGNEVLNWEASRTFGGTPGATNSVSEPEPPAAGGQVPGDSDQDGKVNISDAVKLLGLLFLGAGPPPCDGTTIEDGGNRTLLDLDLNRRVGLTDAVFLLNYLFRRGPLPALGTGCVQIEGCPEVCGA